MKCAISADYQFLAGRWQFYTGEYFKESGRDHCRRADDYDDVLEVAAWLISLVILSKTIKKLKNYLQKTKNGLK